MQVIYDGEGTNTHCACAYFTSHATDNMHKAVGPALGPCALPAAQQACLQWMLGWLKPAASCSECQRLCAPQMSAEARMLSVASWLTTCYLVSCT